jgi:hypothetical protein
MILIRRKGMQKLFVLIIISFLLLSSSPVIAGQFGPAEAQVKPGQFSLGVGYFRYADKLDFNLFSAEVIQNRAFVQAELGLFPTWEIYLRGGMADLAVDQVVGGGDFSDNIAPYASGGLKGLLRRGKYVDLGVFAEASYFHEYDDSNRAGRMLIDEAIVANAGLTFEKKIEGALLYGGPFYHYREGDFWYTAANPIDSLNGTYEDYSEVGGFLGIRWVALKDIVIEAEVQQRNNTSAGATLSFLF